MPVEYKDNVFSNADSSLAYDCMVLLEPKFKRGVLVAVSLPDDVEAAWFDNIDCLLEYGLSVLALERYSKLDTEIITHIEKDYENIFILEELDEDLVGKFLKDNDFLPIDGTTR